MSRSLAGRDAYATSLRLHPSKFGEVSEGIGGLDAAMDGSGLAGDPCGDANRYDRAVNDHVWDAIGDVSDVDQYVWDIEDDVWNIVLDV